MTLDQDLDSGREYVSRMIEQGNIFNPLLDYYDFTQVDITEIPEEISDKMSVISTVVKTSFANMSAMAGNSKRELLLKYVRSDHPIGLVLGEKPFGEDTYYSVGFVSEDYDFLTKTPKRFSKANIGTLVDAFITSVNREEQLGKREVSIIDPRTAERSVDRYLGGLRIFPFSETLFLGLFTSLLFVDLLNHYYAGAGIMALGCGFELYLINKSFNKRDLADVVEKDIRTDPNYGMLKHFNQVIDRSVF